MTETDPFNEENLKKNYDNVETQKGKTAKTKWSENYFISENLADSDEDWSVDSEGGGINQLWSYNSSTNCLLKYKSWQENTGFPKRKEISKAQESNRELYNIENSKKISHKRSGRNNHLKRPLYTHSKSHEVKEVTLAED